MSSDLETVTKHLECLPIFPLPSAALIPFEVLPLHIFEPRYRQMVADVVEDGRPIGIVQLAAGWEGDYEGRPTVELVCGVGLVDQHQDLADGRSNILLRGVARIRIDSECEPRRLYREVRATLLDDTRAGKTDEELQQAMETVRRTLFSLCAARPGPAATALAHLTARAHTPGALADSVAAAVLTDLERRQRFVTMVDAGERLALAETVLADLLVGTTGDVQGGYLN